MQGWQGWDDYAPFYDWENAQTVGRRDLPFWTDLARRTDGAVLELGCGTGRVSLPVAKVCDRFVGIDRSGPMLLRLRTRLRRAGLGPRAAAVRGGHSRSAVSQACAISLGDGTLRDVAVVAPRSGSPRDAAVRRRRRAPRWGALSSTSCPIFRGGRSTNGESAGADAVRGAVQLTLIETVRQDYDRKMTIFDQEFVERIGRRRESRRFSIAFSDADGRPDLGSTRAGRVSCRQRARRLSGPVVVT